MASGEGDIGASRLTSEVLDIINKLPDVVEKLTGVNIATVSRSKSVKRKWVVGSVGEVDLVGRGTGCNERSARMG